MDYDISKMSQEVLECRDFGHSWFHEWTLEVTNKSVERLLTCRRCGTLRRDVVNPKGGAMLHRSYAHGPGYLVLGSKLERNTVRAEAIRRALAEPVERKTKARAR